MATINFATREITAKIVYFGARGAGCNTNVRRLHALVPARRRSELDRAYGTTPEGEVEFAWCFDYLADRPAPLEGFGMAWQVWSLPGGLDGDARREQILRGADAVVFVADARADRNDANVTALLQLEQLLARLGQELANTTVLLQVNHNDAEGARAQEDVVFDLNPYGFPVTAAVASDGTGILETHANVVAEVAARMHDALSGQPSPVVLTAVHDPDRTADTDLRHHQETTHPAPRVEEQLPEDPLEERSFVSEEPLPDLPEGPRVEVPFQPREFAGYHPVRVLGAEVDGDRVWIDLVMERMGGGEARRLTVALANRPTDTPPMARVSPVAVEPKKEDGPSVFDYLPASAHIGEAEEDEEESADLPGIWYGILGVAGGILIGILLSFLLGLF